MSDILKNKALKAVQGAMSNNPIGGSKKVKDAVEIQNYENDDKGMSKYKTNPKATEQPDTPKRNKKKSKTHTAQSRRVS